MTYANIPTVASSMISPESLHRDAAAQLETAAKHHRHAAFLHEEGSQTRAGVEADIAHTGASSALAESEQALKVTLWLVLQNQGQPSVERRSTNRIRGE